MMLSVLICTIPKREHLFKSLCHIITDQINGSQVELLSDGSGLTTGEKRQRLIEQAKGEYVCFIDDDDMIEPSYIQDILVAISHRPDVVGFKGWMFTNGKNKTEWIISNSLPYEDALISGRKVYLRYPNHLSPVKREIALKIGYPPITQREDYEYAKKLKQSGLIKTETFIDKNLYVYHFNSRK
jgi:glycosyltransferase involved in cell wall biosynthesis